MYLDHIRYIYAYGWDTFGDRHIISYRIKRNVRLNTNRNSSNTPRCTSNITSRNGKIVESGGRLMQVADFEINNFRFFALDKLLITTEILNF